MPYQGNIAPIPLGRGGIVTDAGAAQAPAIALQDALNVTVEDGDIKKEGGTAIISAAPTSDASSIQRMLDYYPTPPVQRLLAITNTGRYLKYDELLTDPPVVLATGLQITSNIPSIVSGGAEIVGNDRKAFLFNGRDPVKVLTADGTTVTDITTPPADWTGTNQPTYGLIHNFRLYAILGDFLYGSLTTDHETFQAGDSKLVSVYPGTDIELISMISAFGKLFLFKRPRGVYSFDDSTDALKLINPAVSIAGPHAWAPLGDDIVIISDNGQFLLLSAVENKEPDFQAASLSNALGFDNFIQENFNLDEDAMRKIQATFYPLKQRAIFCVPGTGSFDLNRTLTLDSTAPVFQRQQISVKPLFGDKDECRAIALRRDLQGIQRPIISDSAGNVLEMDQPDLNVKGSAFTGSFRTVELDMSTFDVKMAARDKQFDFIEFLAKNSGNWTMTVNIFIDGNLCDTFTLNLRDASFILDVDQLDVDVLAGKRSLAKRGYPNCCGRAISVEVLQAGLNQGFALSKLNIGFRVIEEQTNT